jgi:hypothetical protein
MDITEAQREAVDKQIRERTMREHPLKSNAPSSKIIFARKLSGLGIYLEKTCPYMRGCEVRLLEICLKRPYRTCPVYETSLALEIVSGTIDFATTGREAVATA